MSKWRSEKPSKLQEVDSTIGLLRKNLNKPAARKHCPDSVSNLLCGFLSHWYRQNLGKHSVIYPGNSRMQHWSGRERTQTKEAKKRLVRYGILIPEGYQAGGRGYATEYRVDIEAVCRLPFLNPSKTLLSKLRDLKRFEVQISPKQPIGSPDDHALQAADKGGGVRSQTGPEKGVGLICQ